MAPHSRPATVNGVAGAVIGRPGRPFAVVAVTVADSRIAALDFVVDPAKLARITARGYVLSRRANRGGDGT